MLRLYIARHGETDYNRDGYFQGVSDIPLNANGIAQAEAIASKLSGVSFDAAFHSPLSRAKVTCEKILNGRLAPVTDPRLLEVRFGEWEGKHRDAIKKEWPEQFENYYSNIGEFHPPGGERLSDARERVGGFFDEVHTRHPSGDVLIVAHQFINALLCTYISRKEISDAWDYRAMPGEVFIFEIEGDNISSRRL